MNRWLSRLSATAYLGYRLRGQSRVPFRPWPAIRATQSARVQRMLAYAYEHVPYYRETMRRQGLTPDDFCTADDLARLPLLDRDLMLRDPEAFVSTTQPRDECVGFLNSGTSTGRRCQFYYDPRTVLQNTAYAARAYGPIHPLLGRSIGYRRTTILPPRCGAWKLQEYMAGHIWMPYNVGFQRQYLSIWDSLEDNIRAINEFRPALIMSYGSYLASLFAYVKVSGIPFARPQIVTYSADALPETARRLIEDEFGVPVFCTYETAEAPNMGFECEEHRGIHINMDLCPVRMIDADGRDVRPGEPGEVVVSNLINRATVMLNCRLGDVAQWLPGPCACGRSLPVLSYLQERSKDKIELPSGATLSAAEIRAVISSCPGVWQYQVVHDAVDHLTVSLVASRPCDRAATGRSLAAELTARLGGAVQVDVEYVLPSALRRTPAGKLLAVVNLPTFELLNRLAEGWQADQMAVPV